MRAFLLIGLLCVALVSGCLDSNTAPIQAAPEPAFPGPQFQGRADQGTPAAGSPSTHGTPERTESPVTAGTGSQLFIFQNYARKTVTISNDFAGATLGIITLGATAGSVKVVPGADDGYLMTVLLEARANTEQEARMALDRMVISHQDEVVAQGLQLSTSVSYKPAQSPTPFPFFDIGGAANTRADIVLTVPSGPAYDLWASLSSGSISVSELRGPRFRLETASGNLEAIGLHAIELAATTSSGDLALTTIQADSLSVSTASGDVIATDLYALRTSLTTASGAQTVAGRFQNLTLSSSSGAIDVQAEPVKSGRFNIDAASGSITIALATLPGTGYDAAAKTASGRLEVSLPDSQPGADDRGANYRHVQSTTYASSAIQTQITAATSSGDITIGAAAVEV